MRKQDSLEDDRWLTRHVLLLLLNVLFSHFASRLKVKFSKTHISNRAHNSFMAKIAFKKNQNVS